MTTGLPIWIEAGFPGELYYMHYHVRDSTGVAVVLAPERLPIGGSALACGAASGDSSGALFVGDPVQGFVLGPECGVRRIELGWAEGPVGSSITVPMSLFLSYTHQRPHYQQLSLQ